MTGGGVIVGSDIIWIGWVVLVGRIALCRSFVRNSAQQATIGEVTLYWSQIAGDEVLICLLINKYVKRLE